MKGARESGPFFLFASGQDEALHYWYLPETRRAPGATTQWLSFRVRFEGFARHSPASHFAVVLRARLGFDAAGVPCSISGRGMTLGDTSLAHNAAGDAAFGGARGAQVESFWPGGNFLFRQAAIDAPLRDGHGYAIRLAVDDARRVEFEIDGQVRAVVDRAAHPVIGDATGALIALGRGPAETGDWCARFEDLATGWS